MFHLLPFVFPLKNVTLLHFNLPINNPPSYRGFSSTFLLFLPIEEVPLPFTILFFIAIIIQSTICINRRLCQNMNQTTKRTGYIGIREIAKLANVSTATVSRVINKPEATSEKVRNRVQKVIEEYNYIPNQTIKNIFAKTSNSIAIFIYDMENPFFITLIKEINQICLNQKYTLLICDTENNPKHEKEYLDYCLSNRCAGIILTEGATSDLFESYNIEIPLVLLDRKSNGRFSTVRSNNRSAMKPIVDYLYNLNHRKIAFAGCNKPLDTVISRQRGYIEALEAKGLPIIPEYIYNSQELLNLETGQNTLKYFWALSEIPTAIICCNDMIALGVINQAYLLNIKIPGDISVVGFDNVLDKLHQPQITTVRQNIQEIAASLFDLVVNPPEEPINLVIDTTFIQGCTCNSISI